MHARGAQGEIRMCAEIEGEDIAQRQSSGRLRAFTSALRPAGFTLCAYSGSPHRNGESRLPQTRDGKRDLGRNGCGGRQTPECGRADFCARGRPDGAPVRAPPPLDDDLAPVVSRVFASPLKPEGRVISVQLDAAFYSLTPQMHSIGLKTAYEARTVVLWDTPLNRPPRPTNPCGVT